MDVKKINYIEIKPEIMYMKCKILQKSSLWSAAYNYI